MTRNYLYNGAPIFSRIRRTRTTIWLAIKIQTPLPHGSINFSSSLFARPMLRTITINFKSFIRRIRTILKVANAPLQS